MAASIRFGNLDNTSDIYNRARFGEEIWGTLRQELRPLVIIFHALIQRRLKRVTVDRTSTAYLLLLSPDDCHTMLSDIGAFVLPGFAVEDYKRIMAMVLYQENYCHHLGEKFEANSKPLLSFSDFAEFLYLTAQYMNPNPLVKGEVKLAYLLNYVVYPHLRDKMPELKSEVPSPSKRKKETMLLLDKIIFP